MTKGRFSTFLAVFFGLTIILGPQQGQTRTFDIDQIEESIVQILILDGGGDIVGTGSGFVVSDEGHIVTNDHVASAGDGLAFLLPGEEVHRDNVRILTKIATYQQLDLAIVQSTDDLNLPRLPLSTAERKKGDPVYAVGFPGVATTLDRNALAVDPTLTDGLISREFTGYWDRSPVRLIQHTADINSGNSGGPLLDQCGRVIGINTAGPKTKVFQDKSGQIVADTKTGVFWASAVEEVSPILERENITVLFRGDVCAASLLGGNSAFELTGLRTVLLAIATFAIAGAGYLLFLWRKGTLATAPAVKTSPVQTPPGQPSVADDRKAIASKALRDGGLVLTGFDKSNRVVRLELPYSDLKRPYGVVIGRSPEFADVVMDDPTISRRHGRILCVEDRYFVEDLNAANGVRVNGKRLKPFQVVPFEMGSRATKISLGSNDLEAHRI